MAVELTIEQREVMCHEIGTTAGKLTTLICGLAAYDHTNELAGALGQVLPLKDMEAELQRIGALAAQTRDAEAKARAEARQAWEAFRQEWKAFKEAIEQDVHRIEQRMDRANSRINLAARKVAPVLKAIEAAMQQKAS